MECIRVEMGEAEAQRRHAAQLVDLCYLLDNTLLNTRKEKSEKQG